MKSLAFFLTGLAIGGFIAVAGLWFQADNVTHKQTPTEKRSECVYQSLVQVPTWSAAEESDQTVFEAIPECHNLTKSQQLDVTAALSGFLIKAAMPS